MTGCYVGLGGNVGDVREAFREAVRRLRLTGAQVTALSGLYRTAPVGEQAGSPFLNAAIELQTNLEPEPVLDVLQDIERSLGRVRSRHWGPRTIDLDCLLYDSLVLETPRLTLPHPGCWYRRFVLDPLAEIAGSVLHPQRRLTVSELRDRLEARPLTVTLVGIPDRRDELTFELRERFGSRIEVVDPEGPPQLATLSFCFAEASADAIPSAGRIQVCDNVDPGRFVIDVLEAALDKPDRIASPEEWGPEAE